MSACRKADVDCILMANIFGEVLRFTFFCVPYGEKQHTQTRTSTSKGKAHLKIWRGQTVTERPTKDFDWEMTTISQQSYLFIVKTAVFQFYIIPQSLKPQLLFNCNAPVHRELWILLHIKLTTLLFLRVCKNKQKNYCRFMQPLGNYLLIFNPGINILWENHKNIRGRSRMWWRPTKGNLMVLVAKEGQSWYDTVLAISLTETTPALDQFSVVHSMISCIQLLLPGTTALWGCSVTSLTLTQVEESLSIWQPSVMKKHFWTLWACLVYLLCLWVALSSVFSPNWILCTHSHRRICISSYARHIYLPHTHRTFAFMCLLPLCIMTVRALPSHLFAFPSQPAQCLRPLLKHQKKHQEEKMWFHLNENKPSKMV